MPFDAEDQEFLQQIIGPLETGLVSTNAIITVIKSDIGGVAAKIVQLGGTVTGHTSALANLDAKASFLYARAVARNHSPSRITNGHLHFVGVVIFHEKRNSMKSKHRKSL